MSASTSRPPGPRASRLLGNTLAYDRDRLGFLRAAQQEYGDVLSYDRRTTLIGDPELIHQVLARTNTDFDGDGSPFSDEVDLEGAAASSDSWMAARRVGWHRLSRTAVTAHVGRLRELVDRTFPGPGVIDPMPTFERLMGAATADHCLGHSAAGVPELVAANTAALVPVGGTSYRVPSWWPGRRQRSFVALRAELMDRLGEAVAGRIAERRGRSGEPRDLLDQLLAGAEPVDAVSARRFVRGVLMAGYGVPAAAMAWVLADLAAYPQEAERVRAEADAAGSDGVAELPVTSAFIREVLRRRPPTWLIGRRVRSGTQLGRWPLPAGYEVVFSPYLLHRDPRWWRDPTGFDLDRWLPGAPAPRRHTYIPFGAGPRVCVGAQLGMLQLALVTTWLVRRFDLVVETPPAERFEGLLVPGDFRAELVERRG
ncbi:cytochrome P450 [Luteipulveratus flavus]|uniref:Cytochrome P450 n=1 Tax=Luteipulveratus flavus TaxID=3031728 RepID=A0ABT6C5Y0_9MICO|nr:cytochrome P450 [Luteipulveratus sp. YIM 133296]MDF8264346.1 cytochrome P450 [Luteipulveratus sp. YIM 133296]